MALIGVLEDLFGRCKEALSFYICAAKIDKIIVTPTQ